jgi:hypothetical protein
MMCHYSRISGFAQMEHHATSVEMDENVAAEARPRRPDVKIGDLC